MDARTRIVVEAVTKAAEQEFKKLSGELSSLDAKARKSGQGFSAVSEALTKVQGSAKGVEGDMQRMVRSTLEGQTQMIKTAKELADKYALVAERANRMGMTAMARGDFGKAGEFTARAEEANKLAQTYREVAESSEGAGKSNKTFIEQLTSSKAAILGYVAALAGVAIAAKKAWEFGEQGAQLSRIEEAGKSLARNYGASMDEIVQAVKRASGGAVAESDIILGANQAMMLGVADTAQEMGKLMEVAAFRGRAMGLSTQQAFSDLVRGIGRMSPMILDNLGIVTGGVKLFDAYAESIGKSTDELTDAEKKTALYNKVLKETDALMKGAPKATEDAAHGFEHLAASLKNVKEEGKKALGEFFGPFAEGVAAGIDSAREFADALDFLGYTVGSRGQIIDEFGNIIVVTREEILALVEAIRLSAADADVAMLAFAGAAEEVKKFGYSGTDAAESLARIKAASEDLDLASPWQRAIPSVENLATKAGEYIASMESGAPNAALAIETIMENAAKTGERFGETREKIAGVWLEFENTKHAIDGTPFDLKAHEKEISEKLKMPLEDVKTIWSKVSTYLQSNMSYTIQIGWYIDPPPDIPGVPMPRKQSFDDWTGGTNKPQPPPDEPADHEQFGGAWSGRGPIAVGEVGEEWIIPTGNGYEILTAEQVKQYKRSGVMATEHHAVVGGSLGGGGITRTTTPSPTWTGGAVSLGGYVESSTPSVSYSRPSSGYTSGGGAAAAAATASSETAKAVETFAQTSEAIVAQVSQMAIAAEATLSPAMRQSVEIVRSNQLVRDELRAIRGILERQGTSDDTAIAVRDAIQQVGGVSI